MEPNDSVLRRVPFDPNNPCGRTGAVDVQIDHYEPPKSNESLTKLKNVITSSKNMMVPHFFPLTTDQVRVAD